MLKYSKSIFRKKLLLSSLALLISFCSVANGIAGTLLYTASSPDTFQFNILDAYYADLDGDGIENDIWISGSTIINTQSQGASKYDLYVDIIDPVGTKYSGLFYVITMDSVHNFTIHAYNTVSEAGWYTVKFEGVVYGGGDIYYSCETFEFDPPTLSGSGSPTSMEIF